MRLGELIMRRRADMGLTRAEAAAAIGITQPALYRIESGRQLTLRIQTRRGICRALEIAPGVLEAAVRSEVERR